MANVRLTIYDTETAGASFVPYGWPPKAILGYLIVPAGAEVNDDLCLVVPGDPHPYTAAELATPADAHFRGFGWISTESMAA